MTHGLGTVMTGHSARCNRLWTTERTTTTGQ
jgi:hypothetical protein